MTQFQEGGGKLPLVVHDRAEFDARLGWVFGTAPAIPGFVRETMTARAAANAALHTQIREQLYGVSPPQETLLEGTLPIPALIVWGEKDRVLHPSGAEILAPFYVSNGTHVVKMPGVGHLPMAEAPEQSAADYLAWRETLGRWNIGK